MITNKDIYLSAKILITKHGEEAGAIADQRMLELMAQDDVKGASVWLGIGQAIEDLHNIKKQKHLM